VLLGLAPAWRGPGKLLDAGYSLTTGGGTVVDRPPHWPGVVLGR
jgi:hypothetical protein